MYDEDLERAVITRKRTIEMMEEKGETDQVKNLMTKFWRCPCQTPEERYECIKLSQKEGNFEFFIKITEFLLGEKLESYSLPRGSKEYNGEYYFDKDNGKKYHVDEFSQNTAYDFKLILSLSRFYQNYETLFEGHMDCIRKMRMSIYPYDPAFVWKLELKKLLLIITKE